MVHSVQFQDCRLQLGHSGNEIIEFSLENFQAESGNLVALTGPSGCGKSTLLNLASGLLKPHYGKVLVLETDLSTLSTAQLDTFRGKNAGFIYQSFNLLEGFSALENVMIGMRFGRAVPPKERRARAVELLNRVGLEKRIHSRPEKLSVGERQRVAIARAIANRPQILLADEPTGALDPVTASEIFRLILDICAEEKCTMLFVTHDPELASRLPVQFDCRELVKHRPAKETAA